MNSPKVLVTGMGVISSIGNNTEENFKNLILQKTGIGSIKILDTQHKDSLPAGEIILTNKELCSIVGISNNKYFSRSSLLALIAAKEAISQGYIDANSKLRTGLISAGTVGGMDKSEHFFSKWINNTKQINISEVISHDCGDSTAKLANYFKITHYVTTISTACSSSANAIMLGARLIKNGILDRAIVGGTDALTRFTLNGFNTLLILDNDKCTPFDENRKGLNLGEGAAYLVLESEKYIEGKKIYAELSGYGNANDAFHQTASSPEGKGALLAMSKALQVSNLNTSDIKYINVHGTGTPNNDATEGKAIETLFGENIPPYSSTKAYTGHTLAACGAIEAIYSILAINNNVIYPNLRFKNKIKELKTSPTSELLNQENINHVLSNSFGFGGNNTSLIFSKYLQ